MKQGVLWFLLAIGLTLVIGHTASEWTKLHPFPIHCADCDNTSLDAVKP